MTCIDCRYFVKIPEKPQRCEVFGHFVAQNKGCPEFDELFGAQRTGRTNRYDKVLYRNRTVL